MCGIATVLDWAKEPGAQAVENALRVLHHRGPDSRKIWQSPRGHVTLGHARLAITDLIDGSQPLANEDGSIRVVVNGEFYDFMEIRQKLEACGHRFRTQSDSEILPHLYEEFGVGCLQQLRGEFAFVLWDERKHLLLAARDRFGIKPLFYSAQQGRLYIASEVKALHAAGVKPAWDEQGLFEKLAVHTPLDGRTLFQKVCELPSAHYLLVSEKALVKRQYWDFGYPPQAEMQVECCDEEYAQQLFEVLDEAVQLRTRADVPLGCYLSGGIDSCSVLGLLQRKSRSAVKVFSTTFSEPEYDESVVAREMAERVGATFVAVPSTPAGIARDFAQAVWHAEGPLMNGNAVCKFQLSRAAQQAGVRVVLTGDGSDEIFGGYATFVKDTLRNATQPEREEICGELKIGSEEFCRVAQSERGQELDVFQRGVGYSPAGFEAQNLILKLIGPSLRWKIASDEIYTQLLSSFDLAGQVHGRAVLNKSLYLHSKTMLPGYTLPVLGDRMEMAHSVEGRPPFLDHKVTEFARRLPVRQKIRGIAEKFILRKAMRSIVTPTVCGRRKQLFAAPPALLTLGQPMHQILQDTLRSSRIESVPFLNSKELVKLLDMAPALSEQKRTLLDVPLMLVFSLCVLADLFKL